MRTRITVRALGGTRGSWELLVAVQDTSLVAISFPAQRLATKSRTETSFPDCHRSSEVSLGSWRSPVQAGRSPEALVGPTTVEGRWVGASSFLPRIV